ncbi:MAG TPA: tetratricopeptide repeat protein [Candidatus Acidoferrales bacterium]
MADQAQSEFAHGRWDEAADAYQKAIALAPHDANLRIALGLALAKAGRPTDAIASYEAALGISPRNSTAEIDLAEAYRAVHNNDAARRLLERSAREHPKAAAPLAVLGDLDIELQTYEAAIKHLSAALALDPANNETRDRLALAYKSKGDSAAALAQLSKSLARDPNDALAHFLRAQIFDDRNQDDRALPEAEKVLALEPQNLPGRTLLGKILLRVSESANPADAPALCSRAADALKPVADAQPSDSETLFILARAYRCAGNTDEAEKTAAAFESASKTLRESKENQNQALHLVHQANDRALQNDFLGALALLQQALEKYPDYDAAYSQLAKLYYSAGDIDKANDAITRALELSPYQPDFLYVQGRIFEKQGKLDEALSNFQSATLVNPKESDAYFEIGAIYQQKNDPERAKAAYKKAVELAPDDADYRRALASLSTAAAPSP